MKKDLCSAFLYLSCSTGLHLPQKEWQFRQLNKTSHGRVLVYMANMFRPRDSCSKSSSTFIKRVPLSGVKLRRSWEILSLVPELEAQARDPQSYIYFNQCFKHFLFFRFEEELQKQEKNSQKPMVFGGKITPLP